MLIKSENFNSSLDEYAEHFHRLYMLSAMNSGDLPDVLARVGNYAQHLQQIGALTVCTVTQPIGAKSPLSLEIELRVYGDDQRNIISLESQ